VKKTAGELLGATELFRHLDRETLEAIGALAVRNVYRPREIVVRQGDRDGDVYLVTRGYLMVSAVAHNGREVGFGVMQAGDLFGEIALFDGEPRSASVVAITQVESLRIDRRAFVRLVEGNPRIALELLALMARRLRRLSQRSDDITGLSAAQRIAKELLRLVERAGQPMGRGSVRIGLKISQQGIGELAGVTRESVNKHLRLWVKSGLIAMDAGHIVIRDLQQFREFAER
jgi:CRP-like cAMP-binding protein